MNAKHRKKIKTIAKDPDVQKCIKESFNAFLNVVLFDYAKVAQKLCEGKTKKEEK